MKRNSFVKFPFIRFEKSKLHDYVYAIYIDGETRREKEVRDAYVECAKFIEEGNQEKVDELREKYNFEPQYDVTFELVKNFTLKKPDLETHRTYAEILENAGMKVEMSDTALKIVCDEDEYKFMRFSDLEPGILSVLSDIDTVERGGKCHPYSVLTALAYNKFKEYETYLVTGRIYQLSNQAKYLHSWVEVTDEYGTAIIDASKNLVTDKKSYYEINHVDETERISSEQVEIDYKMLRRLTDYDSYVAKVYYENRKRGLWLYQKLVKLGEISEAQPASNE